MTIALIIDQILGEPRRFHPLILFGQLTDKVETQLNLSPANRLQARLSGLIGWALLVLPPVIIAAWLSLRLPPGVAWLFDVTVLYFAIGRRSLIEHAQAVIQALAQPNLALAQTRTRFIVSRDCDQLDASGCARATVESVLENGNDSLFATLFWFLLFGAPGALLLRLANTLDAMWGYRTPQFCYFGWAAARLDDALGYFPARLCALSYCLAGDTRRGWRQWRAEAAQLSSPNGGPVMSAGAGALNLRLGGPARYHGREVAKPWFGGEQVARPGHIPLALELLDRALYLWLGATLVLAITLQWMS